MDYSSLLDVEKRTGIKDPEIDDFLAKVNAVESAIMGLKDGTIDPDKMPRIPGIETDEEKAEKEAKRQERIQIQREKDNELRLKRKDEEKDRWWNGAEFFRLNKDLGEEENDDDNQESVTQSKQQSIMDRYNFNYSRWDTWEPADAVSLAEIEEQENIVNERKNKEFEEANPEFCKQTLDDMKERSKNSKKKQESSSICRLRGNKAFKSKDYVTALRHYSEALKVLPYDTKVLINIAQTYIKTNEYDDAMEYLSRTLYLDFKHVKALSRKAFIHAERGETMIALEFAEKALSFENENKDLKVQVDELSLAVKSLAEIKRIKELTDMIENLDPNDKNVSQENLLIASKFTLMKKMILRLRDEAYTLLPNEQITFNIPKGVNVNIFDACCELINTDIDLRSLARTEGLVTLCSDFINQRLATPSDEKACLLSPCLKMLAILTVDDAMAKVTILKNGALTNVMICLYDSRQSLSSLCSVTCAITLRIKYLVDAMTLLLECAKDSHVQMELNVLGDASLASLACVVVDTVAYVRSGKGQENVVELVAFYRIASLFVKHVMFSNEIKNITERASAIVPALGIAVLSINDNLLDSILNEARRLEMSGDAILSSAMESLVEALLGCSQCEHLRSSFGTNFITSSSCTAEQLLRVLSTPRYRAMRSICLGALMNLTLLQSSEPLKVKLISSGAVTVLLDILKQVVGLSSSARLALEKGEDILEMSGYDISRGAGLLSRLATVEAVSREIYQPVTYRLLCKLLAINVGYSISPMGKQYEEVAWTEEERTNLIRILSSATGEVPESCKQIAFEEKLVVSVINLFPSPRLELGEITPASITLPPLKAAPALLLGNAARCLMSYADDSVYAKVLFDKSAINGLERLICAMATCSDIRVRKNIAILLAKGCRHPGVKDRVTHYRGLEMIVELQNKF